MTEKQLTGVQLQISFSVNQKLISWAAESAPTCTNTKHDHKYAGYTSEHKIIKMQSQQRNEMLIEMRFTYHHCHELYSFPCQHSSRHEYYRALNYM